MHRGIVGFGAFGDQGFGWTVPDSNEVALVKAVCAKKGLAYSPSTNSCIGTMTEPPDAYLKLQCDYQQGQWDAQTKKCTLPPKPAPAPMPSGGGTSSAPAPEKSFFASMGIGSWLLVAAVGVGIAYALGKGAKEHRYPTAA